MRLSRFHRLPTSVVILSLVGLASIGMPVTFGFASTPPSSGDSPSQNAATIGPEFKYEPISIKVVRTDATPDYRGFVADLEPDGISIRQVTLLGLLESAYAEVDPSSSAFGLRDNQIVGTPNWATTYLYAIEGKIDPSVASELGKLSPTQQNLARARMLQALLVDRFKLKAHPENREGPVYFLAVAKS
ncbi:MAG TPA: TIGR03435 family protein, partial [Candidatus Acidoferrales bacterium]